MNRLQFITSIPMNVRRGSGCYVGTTKLVEGLKRIGADVELITPAVKTGNYTATRILFNETLRWRQFSGDATIGIDADGYAVAGQRSSIPHVACIKGVLGDAVRYESGGTRLSMALQARLERTHARRADMVITVSHYCAERLAELYGVFNAVVVPELIDLDVWRRLFRENSAFPEPGKFTVLSVCRFYPRKRLEVLLRAAYRLRGTIPELKIRIVGDGPEKDRLHRIGRGLDLESIVEWAGDVSLGALASEYNRADIFCLPSVQEGFGIVFMEAMAAGKAIVAARAAAVPEVVRHGILVEPEDDEAMAEAILHLYQNPDLRRSLGAAGARHVEQFGMCEVSRRFLAEVAKVAPGVKIEEEVVGERR